jgi:formamidopyrimidine-DNA glycosylase
VPELPEVETVRQGLERWVAGRRLDAVEVMHPRAVRRHVGGPADFSAALKGRTITGVRRRGKYLWLPLDDDAAVVGHLGMSGQMLLREPGSPDETHLRIRFHFDDGGPELRFVDQRTFGGLAISPGGATLPAEICAGTPA